MTRLKRSRFSRSRKAISAITSSCVMAVHTTTHPVPQEHPTIPSTGCPSITPAAPARFSPPTPSPLRVSPHFTTAAAPQTPQRGPNVIAWGNAPGKSQTNPQALKGRNTPPLPNKPAQGSGPPLSSPTRDSPPSLIRGVSSWLHSGELCPPSLQKCAVQDGSQSIATQRIRLVSLDEQRASVTSDSKIDPISRR